MQNVSRQGVNTRTQGFLNITLPSQINFGKQSLATALVLLLTSVFWGCRSEVNGFEQFMPAPATARMALAAMLDAWKMGKPLEEPIGLSKNVFVCDKQRKLGQRLAGFEIIGEVSAESGRGFAVRLTLEEPSERPLVRFVVLGNEPIWVFRQEDLEMISHWMHKMDEDKAEEAGSTP